MPALDESARVDALRRYDVLDTAAEREFDDLVKVAAYVAGTPMAVLNFVDSDRQWGKALVGLESTEAPREHSFCSHTIATDEGLMVVRDAREDPRFAENPQVLGDPHIRFYAGASLVTREGAALGSICVVDSRPRELDEDQLEALRALARQAMNQLDLRLLLRRERQQVERLEELDRLKDQFVSVVSHELRTPLTSVRGYLDLVLEDAGAIGPQQLRFLGVANRNAKRLQRLVEDLLDLMRAQEGRLTVDREPVDLAALVDEALSGVAPFAERSGVPIEVARPDRLVLDADPFRIGQVLDNLLSNAVKYTPSDGRVRIGVSAEDGAAVIRVEDSGIGIPADERDRLFESFFRASSATERGIPGTGLGHSISKRVVEAHGGTIELTPDRPRGSEFVVRLPL